MAIRVQSKMSRLPTGPLGLYQLVFEQKSIRHTVRELLWNSMCSSWKRRWLQLRFDCDSTALRPFSDLRYDHDL